MKTRGKTRKIQNKRTKQSLKQAIIARLMEISLKVEDYVYNNILIKTSEAQQYLDETLTYIPKCADDIRILQVSNKIIVQMKSIINENNAKEIIDNELVTLTKSLSMDKAHTLPHSNTETKTSTQIDLKTNPNCNEINKIDLHEINTQEIIVLNETPENVIDKEEIIDLTQESEASQSLLKDCDSQVLEILNAAPEKNPAANNYNFDNNNVPKIPAIYKNTLNLINVGIQHKNNDSLNMNKDAKLTNTKTQINAANISEIFQVFNKEVVPIPNTANDIRTLQQSPNNNKNRSIVKSVIKIDNEKLYPIRKGRVKKPNKKIDKNITENTAINFKEINNKNVPLKTQEKPKTPKRSKYNTKNKQTGDFSWLKNIKFIREIDDNEYIDTILPESFWKDYTLFPELTDEDFYMT